MNYLRVFVGICGKYFEDVEGLELNAAAAITQRVHDDLQVAVSNEVNCDINESHVQVKHAELAPSKGLRRL